MQTHRIALPALAWLALGASCATSRASSWLPALSIRARIGVRHGASTRSAAETGVTATWGRGPPLPAPLAHAAPGRVRLSWRDDAPADCAHADACAWERHARAVAVRAELARLRGRR